MEPPRMPHTSGKPMPANTAEMMVAQMRLAPRKTLMPSVIVVQMLGVNPWFMKPTANASSMDNPRTRPLALRATLVLQPRNSPLVASQDRGGRAPAGSHGPVPLLTESDITELPSTSSHRRRLGNTPLVHVLELPRTITVLVRVTPGPCLSPLRPSAAALRCRERTPGCSGHPRRPNPPRS